MRAENAGLRDEHLGLKESTKDLEKMVQDQSIILEILTNNGHVEEVIKRLRGGEGQASIAEWLQGRPELKHHLASISGLQGQLIAVVERVEKMYNGSDKASSTDDLYQWTQVTTSQVLIRHLFELYFTWVHPVHMLFGEMDFVNSYNHGDEMYCSAPLVNAICAMACNLLASPAPGFDSRQIADRLNLRNGFMNEARSLLNPAGPLLMTSIQAFAVMYLVDLSAGKARNASAYLRCAADHLKLPKDAQQHAEESLQLSAWGVHTLNTLVHIDIKSRISPLICTVLGRESLIRSHLILFRLRQRFLSTSNWTKMLPQPNGAITDNKQTTWICRDDRASPLLLHTSKRNSTE